MSTMYPFTEAHLQDAFAALGDTLFNQRREMGEDGRPAPKLLILAGAQGSGKTYLLEKTLLPSGRYDNYVRLYLPEFRKLHPQYEQMQAQGVLHVYEHTEAFIWALGAKVMAHAFENKYNIIMETALDSLGFAEFPPLAVAAGYRFEVHLIACQKEFSHWSTLDRGVKSVAASELERFVSLTQIEKSQANARTILDAFENACTQVPGSEITLYQRGLEANRQTQPLCHSKCDSYAELTPQANYNGQPFVLVPGLNPSFEIRRSPKLNFPCSYLQYSQVVHAGLIDQQMRQEMVKVCCTTLDKAKSLIAQLPADVFRDLSLYVLKYVHP